MKLIRRTKSVSPFTNNVIDAEIYRDGDYVYMTKTDEEGTSYKYLLEKDYGIFEALTRWRPDEDMDVRHLLIDVSSRCNLDCKFCYEPVSGVESASLALKKFIANTSKKFVTFAGREPTLREDLDDLIHCADKEKNTVSLLTNGIKTADFEYLKRLQENGLKLCIVPMFGFTEEINEKLASRSVLKEKLATLENCRKLNLPVVITVPVARGMNDGEVAGLFDYALKHGSVYDFRLRACAPMGAHLDIEQYYISELLGILTNNLGFELQDILNELRLVTEIARTFKFNFLYPTLCSFLFHVQRDSHGQAFPVGKKLRGVDIPRLPVKMITLPFLALKTYGLTCVLMFLDIFLGRVNFRYRVASGLMRVSLRVWPNIYNIDLEENRKCRTGYQKEGVCTKFCLRNILETNTQKKGFSPIGSSYATKQKKPVSPEPVPANGEGSSPV